MISVSLGLKKTSLKAETKALFDLVGLATDENKIAEDLATLILSRVRRRFREQKNPDGTKWEETDDASIRLSGGYTWAKGGTYAPGSDPRRNRKAFVKRNKNLKKAGEPPIPWALTKAEKAERKWKTAGNTLFSSGNLFHSIMLENRGEGEFSIQSGESYAKYWQNDKYTMIGTSDDEVDVFLKAIFDRIL